jgi:ribonuclease P protein component
MDILSLSENKDFRRIYARGKSFVAPVLVTYVLKNRTNNVRVGITTSKKIGNAVKRNRSRRVIRAAYREIAPSVKDGYDLIFVARTRTPFVKSTDLVKIVSSQLKQAGVLK